MNKRQARQIRWGIWLADRRLYQGLIHETRLVKYAFFERRKHILDHEIRNIKRDRKLKMNKLYAKMRTE